MRTCLLALVTMIPCASAMADSVSLIATGQVNAVAGGCTGILSSFCAFVDEAPSPAFVAKYPVGTPISIQYTLDLSAPGTPSDSPYFFDRTYSAISSGSVTVGHEKFNFGLGTAQVLIPMHADDGAPAASYKVLDPGVPASPPTGLFWSFQGNNTFTDIAVPTLPRAPWTSQGILQFSITSQYVDHILFSLSDVHQIPESSTAALLVIGCVVALVAGRR